VGSDLLVVHYVWVVLWKLNNKKSCKNSKRSRDFLLQRLLQQKQTRMRLFRRGWEL
jgi:hypothetical protein